MRGTVVSFLSLLSPACALHGLPIPNGELFRTAHSNKMSVQAADYPEYNLSVPIDHFHNDTKYEPHSNSSFNLRYWFDAQFYKPGGPVFVLSGGETSGEDRLPFLEKGIVYEIAKATNGLGVILEHRYYGSSIPTPDFSTENLRFLTTEQGLADTAYFANSVKFDGLEDVDFSPEKVPWIAYGGSYAGAFVAFLRVVYPDVFFAAISSSGVPAAIWDYWEYFEAARIYAPEGCSDTQGKLVNIVDRILMEESNAEYVDQVKKLFGMAGSDNADFASSVGSGIGGLQGLNWDPAISDDSFFSYCDAIVQDKNQYPDQEEKRSSVEEIVKAAGYEDELDPLTDRMLNLLGYSLAGSKSESRAEYYSTKDVSIFADDDISQTWRLWLYQVCTEWGFLQTGSGAPEDILPMTSRLVDLDYSSASCRSAFNLDGPANTDAINKYGAFNISYPRLAFVDGEWDPWRAAGVHALTIPPRDSTPSEPMILIDKAVHHWDENGVTPEEEGPEVPPTAVKNAKDEMREFVKEWLKEF